MSLKKYAKKKGVAQSVVITELISNFIEDAKNENTNNGLSQTERKKTNIIFKYLFKKLKIDIPEYNTPLEYLFFYLIHIYIYIYIYISMNIFIFNK